MPNMFMLNREVHRVPLDFDAPIGKTWAPLITLPPELVFPGCNTCYRPGVFGQEWTDQVTGRRRFRGDGLTPASRQISETFYCNLLGFDEKTRAVMSWSDKISQDEVDMLQRKGRLRTWKDGEWQDIPRTADEVNDKNRPGNRSITEGHDGINRHYLIEYRCERLGITMHCPDCGGHGDIATDELREQLDNWEPPAIPEGPGWQMWQTTSEGGPISPVFENPHMLARWLAENETGFGGMSSYTAEQWMQVIEGTVHAHVIETGELA